MTDAAVPIAPRALAPILRTVKVCDVVSAAPPDLTLADLDGRVSASIGPDDAAVLRRAVAQQVRQRRAAVARVKPFKAMPSGLALSDLDLSVRAFNALSRFPHSWLREATIGDLLDTPGLGAGVLTEALAKYEAAMAGSGSDANAGAGAERAVESSFEQEKKPPPVPQRVLEMHRLYASGASLEDVADRFGITRERVRQLFRAHNLRVRTIGETAALRREQLLQHHRDEIYALVDAGDRPQAIAEKLSIPVRLVHDCLSGDSKRQRVAAFHRAPKAPAKPRYSDAELIDCLRTASIELGGVLTTAAYTQFSRTRTFPDGRPWPGHQTPALRFGSWRDALRRAGLDANPSSPIAGQRLFTREHCIDAILEVERELGHPPTAAEYERAATASHGVLPSLATVRHRCKGWQQALALAVRFSQ